jgi:Mrp family chromosome partitioning ATPase
VLGVSHDGGECPAVTEQVALGGESSAGELNETVLQIEPSQRNGHHPAVFFRSTAFSKLISISGEPADLVLIDTPALLEVSDAVHIADHADAVLLVVDRGTSGADLRRARNRLGITDTPLIGYLFNGTSTRRRGRASQDAAERNLLPRGLRRAKVLARGLLRRQDAEMVAQQTHPG